MKAWKDTTGYSHGERGKIEPGSWMIECGDLRVTVTRHLYHPGQWVARSESCGLLLQPLNIPGDSSAKTAQDAALNLVRRRLTTLQDDYNTMLNLKEGDDEKDE
jgi:hypothetical protein